MEEVTNEARRMERMGMVIQEGRKDLGDDRQGEDDRGQ